MSMRSLFRDDGGAAIIELAMVAPVLGVMVIGIFIALFITIAK